MNAFDDIIFENVTTCENAGLASGINTRIYYAPEEHFHKITLPVEKSFEESNIIDEIIMFPGKKWFYIDCLIDENELKTNAVGGARRKKNKTILDVFLLGFSKKNNGFISQITNVPLIVAIHDVNGNCWLIGNKQNPAIIEKYEGTSGKTYSENSGFSIVVTANTFLYHYTGTIEEGAVPRFFDQYFDQSFN